MLLTRWLFEGNDEAGRPEDARPLVAWFGWQMEDTLRRNDHKPCWQSYRSIWPLIAKLAEEVAELVWECVRPSRNPERVIAEASDVAVVCMAIADWFAAASNDRGREDVFAES